MSEENIDYSPTAKRELLWKQYAMHVDLYKFYLDLILKGVTFSYAIAGGIVSYVLTKDNEKIAILAILLPVVMDIALAVVFLYGAGLMKVIRDDVFAIRDALDLEVSPDLGILRIALFAFAFVLLLTASGLVLVVATRWPL